MVPVLSVVLLVVVVVVAAAGEDDVAVVVVVEEVWAPAIAAKSATPQIVVSNDFIDSFSVLRRSRRLVIQNLPDRRWQMRQRRLRSRSDSAASPCPGAVFRDKLPVFLQAS